MEFLKQHATLLLRFIGVFLIVVSLGALFWMEPKKGVSSEVAEAAANVARMEASVAAVAPHAKAAEAKPDKSPFFDQYKATQEKQIRYFLIMMIAAGVLFLAYTFIAKKREI